MLAGNLASICVGGIVSWGSSLIWPDSYDFAQTRGMNAPRGSRFYLGEDREDRADKSEKKAEDSVSVTSAVESLDESDLDPVALDKAFKFAVWASVILVRTARSDLSILSPSSKHTPDSC